MLLCIILVCSGCWVWIGVLNLLLIIVFEGVDDDVVIYC